MADENNKLNAELRKVEDDLFAADDFSAKEPVPLDNAMKPVEQPDFVKPLPVADEDLSPVEAGFVPVKEEVAREIPQENPPEIRIMPEIKTFSENRPLHKSDVFSEPVKPVPQPAAPLEHPVETVKAVPEETPVPVPEESRCPGTRKKSRRQQYRLRSRKPNLFITHPSSIRRLPSAMWNTLRWGQFSAKPAMRRG